MDNRSNESASRAVEWCSFISKVTEPFDLGSMSFCTLAEIDCDQGRKQITQTSLSEIEPNLIKWHTQRTFLRFFCHFTFFTRVCVREKENRTHRSHFDVCTGWLEHIHQQNRTLYPQNSSIFYPNWVTRCILFSGSPFLSHNRIHFQVHLSPKLKPISKWLVEGNGPVQCVDCRKKGTQK